MRRYLVELKVRDVDFALGKLAKRLSTRSVRLARMILIQASPERDSTWGRLVPSWMQLRENALWPYVTVGMLGGIRTGAIPALGHPRSRPGTRAEHEAPVGLPGS